MARCRMSTPYSAVNAQGDADWNSYPKHVWSPAGGWYSQPANWKANTAIMGGVVVGIAAMMWNLSANREFRNEMPRVSRERSGEGRRWNERG